MKKIKKLLVPLLMLIVIAGIIYVIYNNTQLKNTQDLLNIKRVVVTKNDLVKSVSTSGIVYANETRVYYAEYSGKIYELNKNINDYVKKDEQIGKIEVFGTKSKKAFKAPIAGNITQFSLKIGQPVAANQTALFETSNLSDKRVKATVTETEINEIKVGQEVIVTSDALPDVTINGSVQAIYLAPNKSATEGIANYTVEITLKKVPEGIKIGMNTDIEIITEKKSNVISISDTFVYDKDGQKYVKVFTDKDNVIKIEERQVEIGFQNDTEIEIIKGLAVGEEVILPTAEIKNERSGLNLFGQ